MALIDDLKRNFKQGSYLIKLIYINIAIFVICFVINTIYSLSTGFKLDSFYRYWLGFPADFGLLLAHPWTVITYMFMHADIWHILFNLLWFYWFGIIFLQYLSHKQLLSLYIIGGICGAALFAISYSFFDVFRSESHEANLIGASASIMTIVIAISTIVPDYTLNLLFLGQLKLKYIALFTIIIDFISIPYGNAGGYISHLGGALFGFVYAVQYKKGKDYLSGFSSFLDKFFSIFKPHKKMKVGYKKPVDDFEYNRRKVDNQKEMDRILDKIAKGGYDSLTREEKDFLFRSSKQN
jgi:membrane associated rhomboid family serine protease